MSENIREAAMKEAWVSALARVLDMRKTKGLAGIWEDGFACGYDAATPTPTDISVGSRWRVFEDTTHGYWGIEIEQASNDSDPIMYPIKIHRERVAIVVDAHNAEVARLESLHRSEISDMAERFRSVNVSEAVKQLADILPAAPAELSVGVKPLEWRGDEHVGWSAYAAGFGYYIEDESDKDPCFILERHEGSSVTKSAHATLGDAQSHAQSHFDGVIRAALSSPMEGGE